MKVTKKMSLAHFAAALAKRVGTGYIPAILSLRQWSETSRSCGCEAVFQLETTRNIRRQQLTRQQILDAFAGAGFARLFSGAVDGVRRIPAEPCYVDGRELAVTL